MIKFYNREKELAQLEKIGDRSKQNAQMTFVVGRRRIGKTSLLVKAHQRKPMVYFFVAKKSEALLCHEFVKEIEAKLGVEIFGEFKTFQNVFGYLMNLSKTRNFTLIIDEFQQFHSINSSVFSDMQNIWDKNKDESKINLILCGSVYSLMSRIFEHSKEPLFGRATAKIHLKAFTVSTIKEILSDYSPDYTNEDLLAMYLFTGGVAKYVDILVEEKAFTRNEIIEVMMAENSLFLDEGRNVLIEEFGKDYGSYFSVLSLIASSKTSRQDIESIMEVSVGGYLEKLEKEYGLIEKVRPIFSKPNSRNLKYQIKDNFLSFWFRFIYKNQSAIEMGNFNLVSRIIQRDYNVFSGRFLEKYFREKLVESGDYSSIGSYWDKGGQNEIDIVAVNEVDKLAVIGEVKRVKKKISLAALKNKAESLNADLKGFKTSFIALSLEDM